jgi:hypothetical protein
MENNQKNEKEGINLDVKRLLIGIILAAIVMGIAIIFF